MGWVFLFSSKMYDIRYCDRSSYSNVLLTTEDFIQIKKITIFFQKYIVVSVDGETYKKSK